MTRSARAAVRHRRSARPSTRSRILRIVLRGARSSAPLAATIERERLAEIDDRPPARPPRRLLRRESVEVRRVQGTDVVVVAPRAVRPSRAVVVVHGGGYVERESIGTWRLVRRLVRTLDAAVHVPMYRLAPRSTAIDTVPAVGAVLDAAVAEWGAGQVSVVGDSAGGGLALAAVQQRVVGALPCPAPLVLIAPWVDLRMHRDRERSTSDPMLDPSRLRDAAAAYAGALPLSHPSVSPLLGPLRGLPAVLLIVGDDDLLVDQAEALRDGLRRAGTPVTWLLGAGMAHVYPFLPVPEAQPALRLIESSILGRTRDASG